MDFLFKGFYPNKDGKDEFKVRKYAKSTGKCDIKNEKGEFKTVKGNWVKGYYLKAKYHYSNKGIHEDWIIESASQNGGWIALQKKYPVLPDSVELIKEEK